MFPGISNVIFLAGFSFSCLFADVIAKDFTANCFTLTSEDKRRLDARDPVYLFIERDGQLNKPVFPIKLTEPMRALLELDGLYDDNDTFNVVVEKTQKNWLFAVQGKRVQKSISPQGSLERTDFKDSCEQIALREKVERVVRSMGLFDQRNPVLAHYKYGAWLGSFLDGVRNNLHSLVAAWNNGHRFEKLVVFTGERYLRKEEGQEDDIRKLCDSRLSPLPFKQGWQLPHDARYETEYDMMRLVFEQVQLPKDMEEALKGHVEFVNAPRGQNLRPGTKDCYVTWLQTNPEAGAILAASYSLLWVSQQIAGQSVLGDCYPLDTIAPALSQEEYEKRKDAVVSLVHDTVAKCFYEIRQLR